MTPQAFDQRIRWLTAQRPFQPFEIELISGERFTVDRPEAINSYCGKGAFLDASGELHLLDSKTVWRLANEDVADPIGPANGPPQGGMTAEEFAGCLQSLLQQRPFAPFEIEQTDGRHFRVEFPQAIATNGRAAAFGAPD